MNLERQAVWTLRLLRCEEDAERISRFLLSSDAFDDQRFTPGEAEHFRSHPALSLTDSHYEYYFASDSSERVVGVISFYENEQRSGGFVMDYLAVHRESRKAGLASQLIDQMMLLMRQRGGRYVLTYTCDTAAYEPVKHLFRAKGFHQVGSYPDYYYQGEARLSYYKSL